MGEGHHRPREAITRICHPFDGLDLADEILRAEVWHDFVGLVRHAGGPRMEPVERAWRDRSARIVGRSGLHEITLYENSYAAVYVSVWPRDDLDARRQALALAQRDRTAEGIFRRISEIHDLRIATSAWTSAKWLPARPCAGARS